MANDKQWQHRSDEWVKMTHESRRRKEAEQASKPPSPNNNKAGDNKPERQPKPAGKARKRQP